MAFAGHRLSGCGTEPFGRRIERRIHEVSIAMNLQVSTSPEAVVEIENLTIAYETRKGDVEAVKDVSFSVREGETIITGDKRMQERPIADLVDGLTQLGVEIAYLGIFVCLNN